MGVVLANLTQRRRKLGYRPVNPAGAGSPLKAEESVHALQPNWAILGGSSLFVVIALIFGISDLTFKKEIILLGSLGVILI